MKLVFEKYDLTIPFVENQVTVISIESPRAYSEIIGDLWNQINGGDGRFVLSEKDKMYSLSKEIVIIYNPFALSCNDKKILGKLYQEMNQIVKEEYYEQKAEVNKIIIEFLDEVVKQVPYNIMYDLELDVANLFKIYNIQMDTNSESLLEEIINYIKAMHRICEIDKYVFIDLKSYLMEDELQELYEFCFYEKVYLIIIESIHTQQYKSEKCWIIDKDLCTIDLSEYSNVSQVRKLGENQFEV